MPTSSEQGVLRAAMEQVLAQHRVTASVHSVVDGRSVVIALQDLERAEGGPVEPGDRGLQDRLRHDIVAAVEQAAGSRVTSFLSESATASVIYALVLAN